jgi:cytochrome c6
MSGAIRTSVMMAVITVGLLPFGFAQAGNPFKGKDVYEHQCAGCHGARGESAMIGVPNFARGEKVVDNTDARLLETLRAGKGVMPGFQGVLKDAEMLDVIVYMRTLF